MKNKKKVVVVIGIAAILLVSIIGYLMYQKRAAEQAAVEEQFNQIYAIGTDFSAAKSREEQLDILKKTVNERNDYIQSKNNTNREFLLKLIKIIPLKCQENMILLF